MGCSSSTPGAIHPTTPPGKPPAHEAWARPAAAAASSATSTSRTAASTSTSTSPSAMSSSIAASATSATSAASASTASPTRRKRRRQISKWRKGDVIGAGAYGRVYVGLDLETGGFIAIKEMVFAPDHNSEATALRTELTLLRNLEHPNIVQYLGCELDAQGQTLSILTEWVPGGSIQTLLRKFGRFAIAVTRNYAAQVRAYISTRLYAISVSRHIHTLVL